MSRISLAFRAFFGILFGGKLPTEVAQAFGYSKAMPMRTAAPSAAPAAEPAAKQASAPPAAKTSAGAGHGAIQILAALQRDSRLVDFLMEDISGFADDQVGAAVRDVHTQARQALERYLQLQPVIDGVEGDFTRTEGVDTAAIRFLGKVPADGKAPGGLLRHKGWKASRIDLPATGAGSVIAPAELEIE